MLANYEYSGSGQQEMSFTLLLIMHIFIAHILIINFLVAILSQVYGEMLEQG